MFSGEEAKVFSEGGSKSVLGRSMDKQKRNYIPSWQAGKCLTASFFFWLSLFFGFTFSKYRKYEILLDWTFKSKRHKY